MSEFRLARSGPDRDLLSVIRIIHGADGTIAGWEPLALSDMEPSDMACDLDMLIRWAPTAWIDVVDLDTLELEPGISPAAPAFTDGSCRPSPVFLHGNPAVPVRHIAVPDGPTNEFGHKAFCGAFGLTDSEIFTRATKFRPMEQTVRIMSQYRTREICRRCDMHWSATQTAVPQR